MPLWPTQAATISIPHHHHRGTSEPIHSAGISSCSTTIASTEWRGQREGFPIRPSAPLWEIESSSPRESSSTHSPGDRPTGSTGAGRGRGGGRRRSSSCRLQLLGRVGGFALALALVGTKGQKQRSRVRAAAFLIIKRAHGRAGGRAHRTATVGATAGPHDSAAIRRGWEPATPGVG